MDRLRFEEALAYAAARPRDGIGTLGEKTLHAVLKYYFEPYAPSHEVKLGGFVADIVGENGIVEIQTQGFDRLRRKLAAFLEVAPVTVVYPIPAVKWLRWIDPQTGETTERRKSPKRYGVYELLPELYKIKPLLESPGLTLHAVLLEVEETRLLCGWSADRKRGSRRQERIPLALLDEVIFRTPEDYRAFLPETLPAAFTSRDYQKASRLSLPRAQTALNVLHAVGAVRRTARDGSAWIYQQAAAPSLSAGG
ncbi:MAG: hypothetical protein HFG26_06545 [Provencibacterium sp.]|jgi:hypothetical protein|nr:hypothetical protein [Provencibacterium sp.]